MLDPSQCSQHLPTQHYAVIPNDIPWYWHVVFAFIVGAFISYGIRSTLSMWRKELKLPKWLNVVAGALGIMGALGMGVVMGHIVWNWELGMVVSLCGALSSQWVLGIIAAKFGKSTK